MPGSNNFLQWNPAAANQKSDAEYIADAQRAGGAVSGIFPSVLANKLFFQLSTMASALGAMMADKGYVISDADISVLQTALANILTWADVRSQLATGDVRFSLSPTPQDDEVKINGVLLPRVTYANLWAWAQAKSVVVNEADWDPENTGSFSDGDGSTTFRLPDARGVYPRFFDDGRGLDAARVFGSYEDDEVKAHTHVQGAIEMQTVAMAVGSWWSMSTANTGSTGGVENRTKNITFYAFIKF